MKQTFNPILPLNEYIPDGEPHVFNDRIYLFGSHDKEDGTRYCQLQNYVGWSAPISNPSDWSCAGEIYNANQDPDYQEGSTNELYAPDVVRGNDGRFYLYYNFVSGAKVTSGHDTVKVAVCDTPNGRYEYLGFVKNADGTPHNEYLMGDPAVINDNGTIRLYCGWSLSMVAATAHSQGKGFSGEEKREQQGQMQLPSAGDPNMNLYLAPVYQMLFHRAPEKTRNLKYPLMGANTVVLADDMMTVISEPKRIIPGQFDAPKDSCFFGHAFYEASSIRKINGLYYFIYSSENSNELCYATSKYPDKDFVYGGTIISNGDVGYHGLLKENRHNMTANDHGSLECINGQWYIFHHRQTHRSTFSRQSCVEKVEIKADGSIDQVECTSMGFNNGYLEASGEFPAPISCILTNGNMPHCTNTKLEVDIPYIGSSNNERYIKNIKEGTLIGYKYFDFKGETQVTVNTRGNGTGFFEVKTDGGTLGKIEINPSEQWTKSSTSFVINSVNALYFEYHGSEFIEFLSFELK